MIPSNGKKIEAAVGAPFSLRKRWSMKGVGSPQMNITQASIDIHNLLVLDQNRNTCNIELRPKGIIVRFRSLLETYALVIPYYKLNIYKGKADEYSVYKDQYFIKVQLTTAVHRFIQKCSNCALRHSNLNGITCGVL